MSLFRDLLIDKKRKPYYCEVEYLETTNQQNNDTTTNNVAYIDTGVVPDNTTKIECRVQFTTLISGNSNEALFGTTGVNSSDPTRFAFGFASLSPYTNFYMGLGTQNVTTSVTRDTNVHTFIIDASTSSWKIDDTTGTFSNPGEVVGVASIYLFARKYAAYDYANKPANAKVYYCQIWDNGVLVRDLIPVLDWSYVPCMYDKVSRKLFYNQGTGTFSYGREIHYVDYLESTGSQYIDTGIKLTNNHSVEIDYQLTQASQSRAGLFGALNMTGSNQGRFGSILSPSNQQLEHGYGAGNDYWQQGLPDTNRHKLYQKQNETYFDGTLIHTFDTATFSLVINAYLGNFVYTNYTPAKAKYYSSRWWDGNTLVRDYKPAIDENGLAYWFDSVTHSCFLNQGTGNFKYPPVELEYIGTDATTSYIDTGYAGNSNNIKVESIFSTTSTVQYAPIYGNAVNEDQANWGLIYNNTSNSLAYFNSRRNNGLQAPIYKTDGTWNEMEMHREGTTGYTTINGTTLSVSISYDGNENTTNIFIGRAGPNRTPASVRNSKFKTFKIYDNNILKRDLVPSFKDGSSGMYDKENGVMYTNAGSGTFGVGKIKESRWF